MDLHSGHPFWLVKNGLLTDYPQLERDLPAEEIVIIGSGISGALAAYELAKAGFKCTMVDKRLVSSGSTWASTAQLNYELDLSMYGLAGKYNENFAVEVYRASLESVHRAKQIAGETSLPECMEAKTSLYLASDKKGEKEIEKEYRMRRRHGFAVSCLERKELEAFRISKYNCALFHNDALQLDAYRMTVGLIQHCVANGSLTVFTRTAIEKMLVEKDNVLLKTESGHTIRARYLVCAPGYESQKFLPEKIMDLHSTYALVTQPLPESEVWKDRCLIWETKRPYFYLGTTPDSRIMMGGEDEPFKNERRRDSLLQKKERKLLKNCTELFPHLNVQADFTWCGTFGETEDSLPYIGRYPGIDRVFFALGYGGNGTTYSVMAAEVIANLLRGKKDRRSELFGFERSGMYQMKMS